MVQFNATHSGGSGTLAVFFADGESKTIQSTHPSYAEALTYLVSTPAEQHDEEFVRDLVNPALRIGKALSAVDPRFTFDLYTLSYDGLPMTGPLADLIKERLNSQSSDWERFVRFAASLERNPSFHAKSGLFSWVANNGLHILPDGRFLAHKGLRNDGMSAHSGPNNFIDGVLQGTPGVSYHVPHYVGTTISKRRGDVDDSKVACATGLHVGTHAYASGFGGNGNRLVTVAVWPEDVVGGDQGFKIRVCRYEVLSLNDERVEFEDGDAEYPDRSATVSSYEIDFAQNSPAPVREHAAAHTDEYRALTSAGRRLVDNLVVQFAKDPQVALDTAREVHGTYAEWQAARDAEAAEQAAQAAVEAEALVVEEEPVVEATEDAEGPAQQASSDLTLAENAALVPALKQDLENTSLGHKPLARKWSNLTTEASVRRYRKTHAIQVNLGTRIKDALS